MMVSDTHHLLLTHLCQTRDHQPQKPHRHIIHQLQHNRKVPKHMRQSKILIRRAEIRMSPVFRTQEMKAVAKCVRSDDITSIGFEDRVDL